MDNNDEKSAGERLAFRHFLERRGLPGADYESRKPPEPDILYKHPRDGLIAYELIELCDKKIAKSVTSIRKGIADTDIRPEGLVLSAFEAKFQKTYITTHPRELLCYTGGRLIDPDDLILCRVEPSLRENRFKFQKVWLSLDHLWVFEDGQFRRHTSS